MKSRHKLTAVVATAVVALTCATSAVTAGGQVVDHNKVVEDPQLDYRKYSKEIAAGENADRARQTSALQSTAASVGADEAAFHASLAAEAQALNAATPPDAAVAGATTPSDLPTAATPAEAPHGMSNGVIIALGATGLVAGLLAILGLSSLRKKKSRRRRHSSDEKSVSLVDFARKGAPEAAPDATADKPSRRRSRKTSGKTED